MKYSLNKLTHNEMYELLTLFPNSFLITPIAKLPKRYYMQTKGFRLNKLPRNIINKLYYDEISKTENAILGNFLLDALKQRFRDTKIEEIVDGEFYNCYDLFNRLYPKILEAKLMIMPSLIMKLAEIDISESDSNVLDDMYQSISNRIKVLLEHETDVLKQKYRNEVSYYKERKTLLDCESKKLKDDVEEHKKKFDEQSLEMSKIKSHVSEMISDFEAKLDAYRIEYQRLREKYTDAIKYIDELKIESKEQEVLKKEHRELENNVNELRDEIEQLIKENQEIYSKTMSADDVLEMGRAIIDDLGTVNFSEESILSKARAFFTGNETVLEAWCFISEKAREDLSVIVQRMFENKVLADDIDLLDDLESGVLIKYIMVKSLKVLFYKFLEQQTESNTIESFFVSKEDTR